MTDSLVLSALADFCGQLAAAGWQSFRDQHPADLPPALLEWRRNSGPAPATLTAAMSKCSAPAIMSKCSVSTELGEPEQHHVADGKLAISVWLELETECNLECQFCYNHWKSGITTAPSPLPTDKLLEGLDRLAEVVSCNEIAISGGEPLLRKDLSRIVEWARSHSIAITVVTNGTLLTRAAIRALVDLGVGSFEIPIHSLDPYTHDELTVVPSWNRSMAAILALHEMAAPVTPVFVATGRNIQDFPAIVFLWGTLGIRRVIFNRFVAGGAGLRHLRLGQLADAALWDVLEAGNTAALAADVVIQLGVPIAPSAAPSPDLSRVRLLSSCIVGSGQRLWTVDCAANLRRCNQSGSVFGNLLADGAAKLAQELARPIRASLAVRGCAFVDRDGIGAIVAPGPSA